MEHQLARKSSIYARTWLVLAYSAVFGFPLSTEEVRRRYWIFTNERFPTLNEIETSLKTLLRMGVIKKRGEWWHLSSQPKAPANRTEWLRHSKHKLAEAQPILSFLSKLPWVLGVAITGSVAVNSAKRDDDVDFMIITETNRLWLTRLLTLIFAMKHGKRRSFAREEPNSWCFNLWLTQSDLLVPHSRRSLYTAYEVYQALWIYDKNTIQQQFYSENAWSKMWLPAMKQDPIDQSTQEARVLKGVATSGTEIANYVIKQSTQVILSGLDHVLGLLQRLYMKHHQTNEIVDHQKAYFHPRASKTQLLSKIKLIIQDLSS